MTTIFALWLALFAAQTTPPDSTPSAPADPPGQAPAPARRPCRNPDGSGSYRMGCGVAPPKVIHRVDPQFTPLARKKKVSGDVMVSVTVDTDGNPTNVKVYRSLTLKVTDPKLRDAALSLDGAAVDCVEQYKFSPATYQGNPVPVQLYVDVNFQIF